MFFDGFNLFKCFTISILDHLGPFRTGPSEWSLDQAVCGSMLVSTSLRISYNISIGCNSIFSLFCRLFKIPWRRSVDSIIFSKSWTFDPSTSSNFPKSISPRNGDICFSFFILSIFKASRISIFSASDLSSLLPIQDFEVSRVVHVAEVSRLKK